MEIAFKEILLRTLKVLLELTYMPTLASFLKAPERKIRSKASELVIMEMESGISEILKIIKETASGNFNTKMEGLIQACDMKIKRMGEA